MSETLYRIEELATNDWQLIEVDDVQLTREEAKRRLELYIADGYNPNRLRAIPDV